jgi:hypothetical protein
MIAVIAAIIAAVGMAGLRPAQIWAPDTHRPDLAEECRRQCLLASKGR